VRYLTELTWREAKMAAQDDAVVLIPCGSVEQHGPHLPAKTDSCIVESVSRAAAEGFAGPGEILLAPTIVYGASDHHRGFFAMSLSEKTYIDAIFDICVGLQQAGFKRTFLLNGHGGNTAPLKVVCAMARTRLPDLLIGTSDYWALAAEGIRRHRNSAPGGAAHAGEFETSLMMYLDQKVRLESIVSNIPDLPVELTVDLVDGGPITTSARWDTIARDGHIGDAEKATTAQGEEFFRVVVEAIVQALHSFCRIER